MIVKLHSCASMEAIVSCINTTLHMEFESTPLSRSRSVLYGQCVVSLVLVVAGWKHGGNVLDYGHRMDLAQFVVEVTYQS